MFTDLYSFYRSKQWEQLREQIKLERIDESGKLICAYCGKEIVNRYDAICHHKEELTEDNVNDPVVSLNPDNIEVVHHKCHNEIHNRFGSYQRHIYLVWGSPCSGKSSFVERAAGKNDLIVDVDKLYAAVSINPLHIKSNRLTGNVLALRNTLIDMIRTRNGKWINAWVIVSKCRPMELERMVKDLGAEPLHIDTDKETCLDRAADRAGEYIKFIDDYFRDYDQYKNLLSEL